MRQQKNDPVEGRFHRVASPVSRRYRRIRRPRRRSSTSNSVLYRQFRRLLELVAEAREAGVDIGNHDLLDFARYDSLLKICPDFVNVSPKNHLQIMGRYVDVVS